MILHDNYRYLDLTLTFSIVSRTWKQCGLPSRPPPLNCESHLSIRLNHCSKQACILLYSTIYKILHRKNIYILYTKAHGYKQCLYTRVHENEVKLSEDKNNHKFDNHYNQYLELKIQKLLIPVIQKSKSNVTCRGVWV